MKCNSVSNHEINFFIDQIEEYADSHNYNVSIKNLYDAKVFNSDKKYNKDALSKDAITGTLYINDNAYVDFDLDYGKTFYFHLRNFGDIQIQTFLNEFLLFTNNFSKYKVDSSDIKDVFSADGYKKDETAKTVDIDFWGNASLEIVKGIYVDGSYSFREIDLRNKLSLES
ncbi:MAG: hypothetical protein ACI4DY_07685 [Monoglobaceae bacterium]